jgi:hypothetical protein
VRELTLFVRKFAVVRATDLAKRRRQGLVACRALCPSRAFEMRAPVSRPHLPLLLPLPGVEGRDWESAPMTIMSYGHDVNVMYPEPAP